MFGFMAHFSFLASLGNRLVRACPLRLSAVMENRASAAAFTATTRPLVCHSTAGLGKRWTTPVPGLAFALRGRARPWQRPQRGE